MAEDPIAALRALRERWLTERTKLYEAASVQPDPIVLVAWNGQALGRQDCADELGAVLASSPSSGWQPIETAPKDGTDILLWMGGSSLPRARVGLWINTGIYPSTWRCDGHHFAPGLITHWQPLPAPPGLASIPVPASQQGEKEASDPRVDGTCDAPTTGSTAHSANGDAPTLREHDWFGRVCKTCGTTSDRPDASGACRSDTE